MTFSLLIGNEPAKAALSRMLEQRTTPPTLLFYGPEGVGKGAFALQLAEALMGPSAHAKVASGNHPDLHCLRPEGKSCLHLIENIRAMIKEASYPPFEAPVKVFIIHDAHQMLPASSNALLKTLEEPLPDTYFILISSQSESILPTIVSRSRKVAFFPIPDKDIQRYAQDQWHKELKEALRIAFLSHGSFAKAHLLAHQIAPSGSSVHALLALHLPQDYPRFLSLCEELEKTFTATEEDPDENTSSAVDTLLGEIFAWYRDLTLIKEHIAPEQLYFLDAIEPLQKRAQGQIPALEKVLDQILNARAALQRHVKLRVVLEHLLLELSF